MVAHRQLLTIYLTSSILKKMSDCAVCPAGENQLGFNAQLGLLVVSVVLNLISGIVLGKKLTLRCWKGCVFTVRALSPAKPSPETPTPIVDDLKPQAIAKVHTFSSMQALSSTTKWPSTEKIVREPTQLESIVTVYPEK